MSGLAKKLSGQSQQVKMYKDGGVVHKDEKQDRGLVKKMVKPAALTKKNCGGAVKK